MERLLQFARPHGHTTDRPLRSAQRQATIETRVSRVRPITSAATAWGVVAFRRARLGATRTIRQAQSKAVPRADPILVCHRRRAAEALDRNFHNKALWHAGVALPLVRCELNATVSVQTGVPCRSRPHPRVTSRAIWRTTYGLQRRNVWRRQSRPRRPQTADAQSVCKEGPSATSDIGQRPEKITRQDATANHTVSPVPPANLFSYGNRCTVEQ